MVKKKKEVPMPTLEKNKIKKSWLVAVGIGLGIIAAVSVWARFQPTPECVQKNVVNNYVCKIVGMDAEAEMVAVECLTK